MARREKPQRLARARIGRPAAPTTRPPRRVFFYVTRRSSPFYPYHNRPGRAAPGVRALALKNRPPSGAVWPKPGPRAAGRDPLITPGRPGPVAGGSWAGGRELRSCAQVATSCAPKLRNCAQLIPGTRARPGPLSLKFELRPGGQALATSPAQLAPGTSAASHGNPSAGRATRCAGPGPVAVTRWPWAARRGRDPTGVSAIASDH